jgi:hypothetical protein
MKSLPRIPVCTLSVIFVLLFSFANAEGAPKQLSPEELRAAEEDFLKYKDDSARRQQLIALIQMALGTFGYGTGPFDGLLDSKTKKAILAYQKTRGLKQSGEVDALTVTNVFEDYSISQRSIPYLPRFSVITDFWGDGAVIAKGTWIIEQDEQAYPIQTTEITCDKPTKECIEVTAELGNDTLGLFTTRHQIERWDEHEIVSSPKQFGCVRYTMRLLRASKAVTASRTRTSTEGMCKNLTSELRLRLDDGLKTQREQQAKKAEAMREFMQAPGIGIIE